MATVRETLKDALKLIGQLAPGETPTDDELADALVAFNDMLDSWSTERLAVFSTQDQTFTWAASASTKTLGPSGDFVGNRPVMVDTSTYYKSGNISYSISLVNEDQYNAIALKTINSNFPQVMWVNYEMPNITMKVYPVPSSSLEFHIVSVNELTQTEDLDDELVIPPGYKRAFRYNLAVEIASEFGIIAPPNVIKIATTSKKNIKRINNPRDVLMMPYPIMARRSRFNVFDGTPY